MLILTYIESNKIDFSEVIQSFSFREKKIDVSVTPIGMNTSTSSKSEAKKYFSYKLYKSIVFISGSFSGVRQP
jgi:hypothetical protein